MQLYALMFWPTNLVVKYPQGCPRGREDEHPSRMDTTATDLCNGQINMRKYCTCGKICKNIHGLKIHQARMKCPLGAEAAQRTGFQPGETQEGPGSESPHSAWKLQVLEANRSSIKSDRRRIKWPAASMTSLWKQFDEDVDQILEASKGRGRQEATSYNKNHCQYRSRVIR